MKDHQESEAPVKKKKTIIIHPSHNICAERFLNPCSKRYPTKPDSGDGAAFYPCLITSPSPAREKDQQKNQTNPKADGDSDWDARSSVAMVTSEPSSVCNLWLVFVISWNRRSFQESGGAHCFRNTASCVA